MKNKIILLLAAFSILTMYNITAAPSNNSSTIVVEATDTAFQFALEEKETTGSWISADGREIFQNNENVRNGFSADFRIRPTSGSYAEAANLEITVTAGKLTLEATGAEYNIPSISGTIGSAFSGNFSNGVFNLNVTPSYVYGLSSNSEAESLGLTFGFPYFPNAPAGRYTCDINVEYEFN